MMIMERGSLLGVFIMAQVLSNFLSLDSGKLVHTTQGIGRGDYTLKATDLSPATTYYYQAFATNAQGTAVGEICQFTTEKPSLPVLTTATPEVGAYGVLLKGILSDTGGLSY